MNISTINEASDVVQPPSTTKNINFIQIQMVALTSTIVVRNEIATLTSTIVVGNERITEKESLASIYLIGFSLDNVESCPGKTMKVLLNVQVVQCLES